MSADLSPVVWLLGDEAVGRKRAEEALVHAVFGDVPSSFNFATFSAADGAERAVEVAKTVPMMSDHRVVIVREMESAPVGLLDELMAYVEKPNPSTLLILNGTKTPPASGGVDRGRRLENAIKKVGEVRRFKSGETDPIRFAMGSGQEAGCVLNRRAATLLVELVGTDLGRIQTELSKVIAFVGGEGEVGVEDIEAVCSLVAEAAIWDLTDAVVRRDPDRALAVAHRMLDTGEASHRLIAMIAWQMRQLITLQDCMQRRVSPKSAGIRMPHRKLELAQSAIRSRPIDGARMLNRIAAANNDLNRSRAGDRRVFEGLLMSLTTQ